MMKGMAKRQDKSNFGLIVTQKKHINTQCVCKIYSYILSIFLTLQC